MAVSPLLSEEEAEELNKDSEVNDPDIHDIRPQLQDQQEQDELEEGSADYDIRPQLQETPDEPYTKERHQQNIKKIDKFIGKDKPEDDKDKPKKVEKDKKKTPETNSPEIEKPPVINKGAQAEEASVDKKPDPKVAESANKAASKVKAGKDMVGQVAKKAQEGKQALEAGKDIKEHAVEYAKEIVKEKAKDYVKRVAKQAFSKLKQAIVKLIAKNPYVIGIIAGIILLIVIIVAVVFVISAFSGDHGKGPAIYPESALEQQKSQYLLAASGDIIAKNSITKDVIESQLARYDRIKINADTYHPSLSAGVSAKKTQFETSLNAILIEQDPEMQETLRAQVEIEMLTYENTLPFGEWIASMAIDSKGHSNSEFCTVTKVGAGLACASFTSTILYQAGVPNPIVPSTLQIWNNTALRPVINRPETISADTYNESLLQPGDIIWWGDGKCSDPRYHYDGKIFDHVGFYIGNGKTADTSSGLGEVVSRNADKIDGCRLFNGAKRYGKKL